MDYQSFLMYNIEFISAHDHYVHESSFCFI